MKDGCGAWASGTSSWCARRAGDCRPRQIRLLPVRDSRRAAENASGPRSRERLNALALYAALSAVGHLLWEITQLPLYSLWRTASRTELAFAVLHYTGGDVLIALSVLLASVVLLRAWSWPRAQAQYIAASPSLSELPTRHTASDSTSTPANRGAMIRLCRRCRSSATRLADHRSRSGSLYRLLSLPS